MPQELNAEASLPIACNFRAFSVWSNRFCVINLMLPLMTALLL